MSAHPAGEETLFVPSTGRAARTAGVDQPSRDTARIATGGFDIACSNENQARAMWTAALCLCLRRYGAPETATLTVLERDPETGREHRRPIDLNFADTISARDWCAAVHRQLASPSESPPPAESDEASDPWRCFLVWQSDALSSAGLSGEPAAYVFAIRRGPESVILSAERRPDPGEDWPLEQMLHHWERLARGLMDSPKQSVGRLPVLTPAEMERWIHAYNKPEEPVEKPRFGFELFDDQVARTPDAPAVTDGGITVTYREVWQRANRLAHYLQKLGVGPEVPVGVCLERSLGLVVAVLGLQKAGGGLLLLDPGYPPARLHYLVTDSRVGLIITDSRLAARLPPGDYRTIQIDSEADAIAAMPADVPIHGLKPGNMFSVFYTSGSTGRPKGVIMQHAPHAPPDPSRRKPDDLAVGEKVLLKSAIGFTLILREIFWPLQNGGHLVVVPPEMERDSAYMVRVLREHRVVGANFVPSMLALLVDEPGFEQCRSLRLIYTVGESLAVELQRRLFARLPEVRLFVFYGCTEAPSATFRECRPDEEHGDRIVIGRPMARKKVYLLDRHLMPVPPGVAGEIHTGGEISREYLHRPDLTAERFVPNPFSDRPGERMYRTGDLGRWLPDGNLEFIGRADFQVQIGGIRVELGEIETALRSHPAIKEAVVTAREFGPGDRRLVAYYIPAKDAPPASTLRRHLAAELPASLIPSAFVPVGQWPLTPHGKMDLQALPAPRIAPAEPGEDHVAPQTLTERRLAGIWRDVLKLPAIGIHQDFFECGGTSLLAMRVVREIGTQFGRTLPFAVLAAAPTIAQLARRLESRDASRATVETAGLRGSGPGTPLFYIPNSMGCEFVPPALARRLQGERPFFDGLAYPGVDGRPPPARQIEAIAADLVRQIRAVRPSGPYCLAGYCIGGLVAYEIAQQLTAAGPLVTGIALWDGTPAQRWRRRAWREAIRLASQRWAALNPAGRLRFLVLECAARPMRRVQRRLFFQLVQRGAPPFTRRPGVSRQTREVVRATYAAVSSYRPKPYSGRVLMLCTPEQIRERLLHDPIPNRGWDGLLRGPVEVATIAHRHTDLLKEPASVEVADHTARFLQAADALYREREASGREAASSASSGAR